MTDTRPFSGKAILKLVVRPDGVAVVTIDDTEATLNTLTDAFGAQLEGVLDRIAAESAIVAAVFVSGKKDSFIVGANISTVQAIRFASDAESMARRVAAGFSRIGALGKPVVAAVNGQALGGGFELALACSAIVMTDDPKSMVGLPEVQLGLLPGANGLLRVAERAGLQVALDLGLTGKNTRSAKAKKLGLVDEVCPRSVLVEVAAARALALLKKGKAKKAPPKASGREGLSRSLLEDNPVGRAVLFKKARAMAKEKSHGHYPAVDRILDVLERYGKKGFKAAAELEATYFGELVVSAASRRLVEIFFATQALKKDTGVDDADVKAAPVESVSVLGGGLMGAGIAYVTVEAGLPVRIKDVDDSGVGRALGHVRGLEMKRVKRKQVDAKAAEATLSLLTAATDYSGIARADVVIEAVFEDLALKHEVLKDVEMRMKKNAIFASNTSSLPISKIAEASRHPEQVVGMHYFSPVDKMPLLEVIETEKTAPWVVATAVALGKRQGKTVIVVKDGVGFYTSRVLAPYVREALFLALEGVPIDAIDDAMVAWGFPVGPMQLLDEVGIDVAAHVAKIMHEAFGERMAPPRSNDVLDKDDRKGRKNGRGFYRYDAGAVVKGRRQVDKTVYDVIGVKPTAHLPPEEIQMRCALQLVNEAVLTLSEGVLRSPRDGDIGAIFGLGFPPFRGGPFRYVDAVGPAEVLRRMRGYEDRFGARWAPAPSLVERAKTGAPFYEPAQ